MHGESREMLEYLLCTESDSRGTSQSVLVYDRTKMVELFSVGERSALNKGEIVRRPIRSGKITYVDMRIAAKRVLSQQGERT